MLSGCTTLDAFTVADSATTYHLIDSGDGLEANPFLPSSPAGAALVSAAATKTTEAVLKKTRYCVQGRKILTSVKGGASINNTLIMLGASSTPAHVVGLIGAVAVYNWDRVNDESVAACTPKPEK